MSCAEPHLRKSSLKTINFFRYDFTARHRATICFLQIFWHQTTATGIYMDWHLDMVQSQRREPQPVRYTDRGTDNNTHCSLFRSMDCKMLAACRLTQIKGIKSTKWGVDHRCEQSTSSKNIYIRESLRIFGGTFWRSLSPSNLAEINGTFYQFWCCVIVQLQSRHQCGL